MPRIDSYDWAEEGMQVVCTACENGMYRVGEVYTVGVDEIGTLIVSGCLNGSSGEWEPLDTKRKKKGYAKWISDLEEVA